MLELNHVERRALRLAAVLVVLGTAVRLGFGPGPADTAWRPAGAGEATGWTATRDAVEAALEKEMRAGRPLADGERIDPNRAPEEELRRLPGVGPARARAIIETRAAGPFASAEDLSRVPGIGPAGVARLRPHLALPAGAARGAAGAGRGGPPGAWSPGGAAPGASADPLRVDARIDVNRADTLALRRLPGIGPARARQIVRTRERLGGFRAVEDLLEVPGIGPATLERLRPRVRVGR